MKKFIITTDSACDLPMEICDKMGIYPIFLKYSIGESLYLDTLYSAEKKLFFDRMRSGANPTTSAINPSEYYDFWRKLIEKHHLPIIHLSISSGISSTYRNSVIASEMIKEENPDSEIRVVDTTIGSLGQGMLVLFAANLRDGGHTAEECEQKLNCCKYNINTFYTTGNLKYFLAGGRLSRTGAVFGTVLNINPILELSHDGTLKVAAKPRGADGALKKICEMVEKCVVNPTEQTLFISHADAPERAKMYALELCARFGFKNVFFSSIGTVMGSHCGPDLVAVFFLGQERDSVNIDENNQSIAVITSPEFQEAYHTYFLTHMSKEAIQ